MSQENVEITRASIEMWNAADWEAYREQLDPSIMVRTVEDWPEAGPYVGKDAVVQFFKGIRDGWDADAVTPISFVDAGDRVVLRHTWRGAGHGPDMDLEVTLICTFRKRKIVLMEYF